MEMAQEFAMQRQREKLGLNTPSAAIASKTTGLPTADPTQQYGYAPKVYGEGTVPVGGGNAGGGNVGGAEVKAKKGGGGGGGEDFHPYGRWKTVKVKKTEEEKAEVKTVSERQKYGIVVNKMPVASEPEEEEVIKKSDMAGMGVMGMSLGKRGHEAVEEEGFKAVSFKKPKAFRKKKTTDYS